MGDVKPLILSAPGFSHVTCLDWSPCGKFLIAGSNSNDSIIIWSVENPDKPMKLSTLGRGVVEVKFSSDGLYCVAAARFLATV